MTMEHVVVPSHTRFLLSHPVPGGASVSPRVKGNSWDKANEKEGIYEDAKIELMRYGMIQWLL